MDIKGKNIIVTGSEGLLGKVTCGLLKELGCNVVDLDIHCGSGVDISNTEMVKNYCASLEIKIDGLVNNAAVSFKGTSLTDDQFITTMNINIMGTKNMIKYTAPVMSKRAAIVNIASVYGVVAPNFKLYEQNSELFNSDVYGATKAAVIQLTKYYANIFAGRGIRVNAVSPGGISGGQKNLFVDKYNDLVPMGRMAKPEEIAKAIIFLLSDMSSYITGHNLVVDGGLTIR